MEKLSGQSMNLTENNIDNLKQLFPEVFTEGKIDFDKLRLVLGDNIEENDERYQFTWNGKSEAIKNAQTPSMGTLRPDKDSSKNWDNTENLYIEGDNLEVLKLLQKSYFGKIKMIYIDPPYNTGKDFVYKDNFRDSMANYKEITNQTTKANVETSGRYHTDWLNMMYPRLKLARNLLREDGVIFISIANEEQVNLKKICDEVFGEDNFIETFIWTKTSTPPSLSTKSRKTVEYILCYERSRNNNKYRGELLENGDAPLLNAGNNLKTLEFPIGKIIFKINDGIYKKGKYDKVELLDDIVVKKGINTNKIRMYGEFKWTQERLDQEINKNTYFIIKSDKFSIRFQREAKMDDYKTPTNLITERNMDIELNNKNNIGTNESASKDLKDLGLTNMFDYTKPVNLIKYISKFITKEDDMILDFFSGSSTTAHAVMQLNAEDNGNRKFIMVQLPETTDEKSEAYKAGYKNICEIGKERIRRSGEKVLSESGKTDLDIGFKVFKLDDSNIKTWNPDYNDLEGSLEDMTDNLKSDRSKEDLLYEILIKMGIELTDPIEEINVGDKKIYNIGEGSLVLCLEDEITEEIIKEIPKYKSDFVDMKVVFKETGFSKDVFSNNDSKKMNAMQNLKQFGITDVRSV